MSDVPLLETRATFDLAALVVTLVAISLIGVVVANLHTRLLHLERGSRSHALADPYARLSGTAVADVLGAEPMGTTPRAALVVSEGCAACDRVLRELRAAPPPAPIAVFWGDGTSGPSEPLPPNVTVRDGGARLRHRLGIGVTPFALVINAEGVIVEGFPLSTIDPLIRAMNNSGHMSNAARAPAL